MRAPGWIPAGRTDESSVVTAVDLFPTFCALAGIKTPRAALDGEDMSSALRGKPRKRRKPIFWQYNAKGAPLPGLRSDQSPGLAVRDGRWKLLLQSDGSGAELYDMKASAAEKQNLAAAHPDVARRLSATLMKWKQSLPAAPAASTSATSGDRRAS